MTHPAGPVRSGWAPASPCGAGCRPEPARSGTVRAARRALVLAVVLLAASLTAAALPALTPRHRATWTRATCRTLLAAAGVRVHLRGSAPGPGLLVANHLSWIEVLALPLLRPVRLLAKAEVRSWPGLGSLAALTGALFVDRARLRALPDTVAEITAALAAGDVVAVFPEGTTWCGGGAGPLRRAAFQAALDARALVHPVAVVLLGPDGAPAPVAAFIGDDGLLAALGRVLRARWTTCELTVLPPLPPRGERSQLAAAAAAAISAVTGVPHADAAPPASPPPVPVAAPFRWGSESAGSRATV